jgi:hypothetical protein
MNREPCGSAMAIPSWVNNDFKVYAARILGLVHWGNAPANVLENLMVWDSSIALWAVPHIDPSHSRQRPFEEFQLIEGNTSVVVRVSGRDRTVSRHVCIPSVGDADHALEYVHISRYLQASIGYSSTIFS